MTEEEARDLTAQIVGHAEQLWLLVMKAWREEAWNALGYADWGSYCLAEFDTAHLSVPKKERAQVVGMLRDAGMTLREIGSATNTSKTTANRDLVPDGTRKPRKPKAADPPNRTDVMLSVACTRYTTCGMTADEVATDLQAAVEKLLAPLAGHDCEVKVTVAMSERVSAADVLAELNEAMSTA